MSETERRPAHAGVLTEGDESRLPAAAASSDSGGFPDDDTFLTLARSSVRQGYWSWDLTTGAVWYSEEFYRLHGVRAGALGDRVDSYLAFVHPDDRARVTEGAWAAATGDTVPLEYRFVHPEGGLRHFLGHSALVRDRSGQAQRLVGTVQDVTEVLRARRSVAEAFTRLAAFFDELPTPAYLWRREGDELRLRRFNKAALARWGGQAVMLEGAPASELCADRPDMVADIEECLLTQKAVTRETYYESERLGRRPLVMTYVPVALDAVVAHAEDISELLDASHREQRATAQLAEYFQRVPTPAFLWRGRDGELVLEAANGAGEQATEGRVRDLIGITAAEMYAHRPDIVEDLHRALAGETFTREMQYAPRFTGTPQDLVVTYVHIPPDAVAAHTREVTQQRLMEAALRDSHEAARGILDACAQPILLCETDGTMLAVNDAVGKALGVPRQELIGRIMYDFFPASVVEKRRAAIERVVRERAPVVVDDVHDDRHFRASAYPLVDEAGEVSRVVIYAEDVTEERRARDALIRSRERLEEAQRVGHLGHWDWNVERDELEWSNEAYRIFGVDPATPVSFAEFLRRVHPEDRELVRVSVERALARRGPYAFEHRIRRVDGSTRYVLEQGEVNGDADNPCTMTGTVLDITPIKKAEEVIRDREREMATIIERNPDGICLIVGGRISVCNGAMADLVGLPKQSIVGRRLHDLMTPEDRDRARERGRSLLDGGPPEPREYTLVHREGSGVPVEIYAAAFDFRGEPALICTLRDIGKRKQAERELAESRDALRALTQHLESVREQERAQVARDLHDELGSVLTALKIDLAELVCDDSEAGREVLLGGMSERLDQAIEVGRRVTARLRPGILDDLGLVAAAEWLGDDLEKRTGVRCRVVVSGGEPELPEPVATTMFRILQEALTNVIRHAEADAVEVELATCSEALSLTVSDNGKGFDTEAGRGGGFGLLGMRERVRAFRGSFTVCTSPGEGTKIRVALPLSEGEAEVPATP